MNKTHWENILCEAVVGGMAFGVLSTLCTESSVVVSRVTIIGALACGTFGYFYGRRQQ